MPGPDSASSSANGQSRKTYDNIEDFVRQNGGSQVIRRILIANNGNAAIKAIRSMRSWAYQTFGNEKEIEFVVMATIDDVQANAEYISEGDIFVEVPPGTNNNNFANVNLIVQLAEEYACDAVWPGWGHASENHELPLALSKAKRNVGWIGPNPKAMLALGDKIGSTIIAQSAKVACVPWSGDGVSVPEGYDPEEGLTMDTLKLACVSTADEVLAVCSRIGYPVMIKASEGGGGKGIRKVTNANEVANAFWQVVNEVKGSLVFVMQMVQRCRHLEVQVFADHHGNAYSLGTRDCSIQRRNQKIIEEGPVAAAPAEVVKEMEDAAVRMAKKVGYTNAGTVEFLYDAETKRYYFCEVNARLQVEHVVTEIIDDINLPAAQLQVAMGVPMTKIADVARFLDARAKGTLPKKHCIACRITAEHAEAGFRPTSGAVHEVSFRSSRHVWGYFSIGSAGRIHAYADSQFGHIFSSGETREDARGSMIVALKNLIIRGEIRTNVEALMRILETADYMTNKTHTTWLEASVGFSTPLNSRKVQHSTLLAVMLASAYEASAFFKKSEENFKQKVAQGQLPPPIDVKHEVELVYKGTKFILTAAYSGPNSLTLEVNGSCVEVTFRHVSQSGDGGFLVSGGFDGRSRMVFWKEDPSGVSITFEGATYTFTRESDPTQVRAPVSGKLVRWLAANDTHVVKGAPYCEIEIMKMYMQLPIHETGKISHVLSEGAVFQPGDLLGTLELPDGTTVQKAVLFAGQFPTRADTKRYRESVLNPLRTLRLAQGKLTDLLNGYSVHASDVDTHLKHFLAFLMDPQLPVLEFNETLSILQSQMPEKLKTEMLSIAATLEARARNLASGSSSPSQRDSFLHSKESALPCYDILRAIEAQLAAQQSSSYSGPTVQRVQLQPMVDLVKKYEKGIVEAACATLNELFNTFILVEDLFHANTEMASKTIQSKRTEHDADKLTLFARSHQSLKEKNRLIQRLIEYIRSTPLLMANLMAFHDSLQQLSAFTRPEYSIVGLRARQLLLTKTQRPMSERTCVLETAMLELLEKGGPKSTGLYPFISDVHACPDDSLVALFAHENKALRKVALEIFVRRHYDRHGLHDLRIMATGESWAGKGAACEEVSPCTFNRVASFENIMKASAIRTPTASNNSQEDECLQEFNTLIGVWSHQALLCRDFIHENCDKLVTPRRPGLPGSKAEGLSKAAAAGLNGSAKNRTSEAFMALGNVGAQRDVSTGLGNPSSQWPPSSSFNGIPGLEEGSRLHHMLNAFGSSAGGEHMPQRGVQQQSVGIAFPTWSEFQGGFAASLKELVKLGRATGLLKGSTGKGKTITETLHREDSRVLTVFIAHVDSKTTDAGHAEEAGGIGFDLFRQELQRKEHAALLCELGLALVTFVFNRGASSAYLVASPKMYRDKSGRNSSVEADQGSFRVADIVSQNAPNYIHLRCRRRIPLMSKYTGEEDIPHTVSHLLSPTTAPASSVSVSPAPPSLNSSGNGNGSDEECNDDVGCDFNEETLLRNVESPLLPLLELNRLEYFKVKMIPTSSHNVHLYEAQAANATESKDGRGTSTRFFVRIILRYVDTDEEFAEQERYIVVGLNALEVAIRVHGSGKISGSHILMSTVGHPNQPRLTPATVDSAARKFFARYEQRLLKNHVNLIEMRYMYGASDQCLPFRIILDNPTGQALRVRKFLEVRNPTSGEQVFTSLDAGAAGKADGDYDGRPVHIPHPLAGHLDQKRALAASLSTVYIYDFLDLFEEAVKKQWRQCPKYFLPPSSATGAGADSAPGSDALSQSQLSDMIDEDTAGYLGLPAASSMTFLPDRVFEAVEMSLQGNQLVDVCREPGRNDCAMVAWRVKMCTPEFPKGRRMILIGNDITTQMGTFGVQEDLLFQRASELARKQGIPRVYIAVNSGARMGLATEVQKAFKVEFIDKENPGRGFKYLYLSERDYRVLKASDSVVAEPVDHPTEGRIYKITDIIGSQIGLGVENLCGSGAIAGETARAYLETFTITLVSGRSVGIGAYITRLGQRVIQKVSGAPILLTGANALNRLIGRDVYSSNEEIGGVDVMYKNGVSHLTVKDDIEGCEAILNWLSYVPEHRDGPLPIMADSSDPVNRAVQYRVTSTTEDPRLMLTGCVDQKGQWQGGLFDRGSFREVMGEWAKSVIVGRARLGGFPLGVILVETRVTEACQPADPAMPHTSEMKVVRAGQVWYPDSAFKTAQAIQDFNHEELPLMIFANWRGFSGGQRDMFNEILKFGSYIVDALVGYKQPCFVYIPPKAELRGGAWVVVDPRINQEYMEMYADAECRGGVLEPTGTVEIKFREPQLIEMAGRLDHVLQALAAEEKELAAQGMAIDSPRRQEIKEKRDRRIAELMPVYKQVALHFADLHDTAVRMKKKHAVHDVVNWEKARQFFYWRLRRQLILFGLRSEITKAVPSMSLSAAERVVYRWIEEAGVNSNYHFVQWASSSIKTVYDRIAQLRRQYVKEQTAAFAKENLGAVWESVAEVDPSRARLLAGSEDERSRVGSSANLIASSMTAGQLQVPKP